MTHSNEMRKKTVKRLTFVGIFFVQTKENTLNPYFVENPVQKDALYI